MKSVFFLHFVSILIILNTSLLKVKNNYWGFYGHKYINKTAVFLLPQEMFGFYKINRAYLEENAVNPDSRRYLVANEAPKHYIDLDLYNEDTLGKVPIYWKDAVNKYSEDSLKAWGIVPWHIYQMSYLLTKAFEENNPEKILRYSAEIGHYIADANVPLHTTSNYNGQKTGQKGIHGLWESRLAEIYLESYDLFFEDAVYLENIQKTVWHGVRKAHTALDSVFTMELSITKKLGKDKKMSFEERNGITVKTYSQKFCEQYHKALNGMVERRLRASIKMVADVWFTCWVNAGQPNLDKFTNNKLSEKILKESKMKREKMRYSRFTKLIKSRTHEVIE